MVRVSFSGLPGRDDVPLVGRTAFAWLAAVFLVNLLIAAVVNPASAKFFKLRVGSRWPRVPVVELASPANLLRVEFLSRVDALTAADGSARLSCAVSLALRAATESLGGVGIIIRRVGSDCIAAGLNIAPGIGFDGFMILTYVLPGVIVPC